VVALASGELIDLLHGDFDLCEQIACPLLVKPPDCIPATCARLDTERKRRGAIYMIRRDGEEADFVAMLRRRAKV
jgi:hypothetical protein